MDDMRLPSGKTRRNLDSMPKERIIEAETVPPADDLEAAAEEYKRLLRKYTEEADEILASRDKVKSREAALARQVNAQGDDARAGLNAYFLRHEQEDLLRGDKEELAMESGLGKKYMDKN